MFGARAIKRRRAKEEELKVRKTWHITNIFCFNSSISILLSFKTIFRPWEPMVHHLCLKDQDHLLSSKNVDVGLILDLTWTRSSTNINKLFEFRGGSKKNGKGKKGMKKGKKEGYDLIVNIDLEEWKLLPEQVYRLC